MLNNKLIIREMKIKIIMRHHLTFVSVTINNKCWQGCALLVRMLIGAATIENNVKIVQKIRNRITI